MNNEKMREEFEEWVINAKGYSKSNLNICTVSEKYSSPYINRMWEAWQASREDIEIELPNDRYSIIETFDTDGNLEDTGIYSSNESEFYKVKEVKQKLTEQGIKVK